MPNFHLDGYLGLPGTLLIDMTIHGSYYFIITFPIFLLLHNRKMPVLFLYFLFFIPALFEFSQALIPGRSVSAHDLIANYLGIAPALSICFFVRYIFRETKK
jgi:VanZ family protein